MKNETIKSTPDLKAASPWAIQAALPVSSYDAPVLSDDYIRTIFLTPPEEVVTACQTLPTIVGLLAELYAMRRRRFPYIGDDYPSEEEARLYARVEEALRKGSCPQPIAQNHQMNYPKAHANRDHFIMQVPRISTAHITAEDGAKLCECRTSEVFACENYGGDPSWHMVCLSEFDPSEWQRYSSAFALVLQFFADLGYGYLALDADGDVIPELPTFEW